MDVYQEAVIEFFKPYPQLSPSSCHQFILDQIAPAILPFSNLKQADVQPCPFQGSMSYTAILSTSSERLVVQFRSSQQDLFGVTEARHIHGDLVPLVSFYGEYEGLFVYTSSFVEGIPYIHALMESPDFEFPLVKTMKALHDMADIITRNAGGNIVPTDPSSLLDGVKSMADAYPFRKANLRSTVLTCISKLMPLLPDLAALPSVLNHQDLGAFNFLIDEPSCHILAVLDWDGALYLPVGSNFHFLEIFFGHMTPISWRNSEDRDELEASFYARVLSNLASQGFGQVTEEQLELQKAIGILEYYSKRILQLRDERTERYLEGYLERLSFMRQ
ncbi:hypothetical protein K402DRAFT_103001 [Aulographum hederae CBS 113979]|uniref:Aminoglycoside phosphotransferase domain-containing protein n=1 Tax=Aulographum hederae CBS 113979 TaxID=1176131 RepID=A0A6G1GYT3_9PEZI|nr:hypothetical protein K402DRAFT_103001 [Aulographum hederae CBS 113979]